MNQWPWLAEIWFLLPNWKWFSLALIFLAVFTLRPLLESFVAKIKRTEKIQHGAPRWFKNFLTMSIENPLSWALVGLLWMEVVRALDLTVGLSRYLTLLGQLVVTFNLIRLAYLAVDSIGLLLTDYSARTSQQLDDQLASFATKTLRVLTVVIGILLLLQNTGFNVLSLLAGLGLGGLALALAAQDTAANVFGSIMIILDKPFKVGDHIKVGDTEGTVESIGFRSTRIRTFYSSVVTIPNSTMAKEKIDNLGVRPNRRVRHVLGVTYDTDRIKLAAYIEALREYLIHHPEVERDSITVTFSALGDFSLQILTNFYVRTSDLVSEHSVQQEFLLAAMELAERLGVEFAFPTQTVFHRSLVSKNYHEVDSQ